MSRILITGASGMVGRNICQHSSSQDYELLVPSRKKLDLLDKASIDSYLSFHKPDMIVHCAGTVGGIQANMREPIRFLMNNLNMGTNLIMSAREQNTYRLINLGSSCMYPRDAKNPLKEDMLFRGELEPTNEGYAISKLTVAKLCEYVSRENSQFKYKTIIPCNIYGHFDNFDPSSSHMIPAIIRKIHEAKIKNINMIEIWGDGTAYREFMFAADFSDCIWRAIKNFDTLPQNMNCGLGQDWSINEYYQIAAEVISYQGEFSHDLTKPVGMKRKLVDSTLLSKWGWKPSFSLQQGMKSTYEYFINEVYAHESL